MISKAQKHISTQLKYISKIYNVPLYEEIKEGNKKYDFYFPTLPPIVIEVNGSQHYYNEVDGFFFKNSKDLMNYKLNDKERKDFHKIGKILLIEFTDKEFPSLNEILEILENNNAIKILKEGIDTENAYYIQKNYNRRKKEERNRKIREFNKKQRDNFRNRFKQG